MAETKRFLDLTGLSRYNENIKGYIGEKTGNFNSLTTTDKTNLVSAVNEVNSIAKGAQKPLIETSYSTLIDTFSSATAVDYRAGQSIYIKTVDVPDVWISKIESTAATYTYTTDAAVIQQLNAGTFKVGYYMFSKLETEKVDLSGYATSSDLQSVQSDVSDLEENKLDAEVEQVIAESSDDLRQNLELTNEITGKAIIDLNNKIGDVIDSSLPSLKAEIETGIETTVAEITDTLSTLSVDLQKNITWEELRSLRNSGSLTPGMKYRITDYTTTTGLNNIKVAGHDFDIIVTALTESTLSEEASAAIRKSGGNTHGIQITNGKRRLYKVHGENAYDEPDLEDWYDYVGEYTYNGKTCYLWQKYEGGNTVEDQSKSFVLTDTKDLENISMENFYVPLAYFYNTDGDEGYSVDHVSDTFVKYEVVDGVPRIYKTQYLDVEEYYEQNGTYTYDGRPYYLWTKIEYNGEELNDYTVICNGALITDTLDIQCSPSNPFHPVAFLRLDDDDSEYSAPDSEDFIACVGGDSGGSDPYFENSNIETWKIWYCLDNNTDRFSWAATPGEVVETYVTGIALRENGNYVRISSMDRDGKIAWGYVESDGDSPSTDDNFWTDDENPGVGSQLYKVSDDEMMTIEDEGTDNEIVSVITAERTIISETGKGVIYRMIDENGNDLPYDFKNIMFPRHKITFHDNQDLFVYDPDNNPYFLGFKDENGITQPSYGGTREVDWFTTFSCYDGSEWYDPTVAPKSMSAEYVEDTGLDFSDQVKNVVVESSGLGKLSNIVFYSLHQTEDDNGSWIIKYTNIKDCNLGKVLGLTTTGALEQITSTENIDNSIIFGDLKSCKITSPIEYSVITGGGENISISGELKGEKYENKYIELDLTGDDEVEEKIVGTKNDNTSFMFTWNSLFTGTRTSIDTSITDSAFYKLGQFLHSNGNINDTVGSDIIGVCVIPSGFATDGKARFMSLVNMSSSSTSGTTSDEYLQWCTTYNQLNLSKQYTYNTLLTRSGDQILNVASGEIEGYTCLPWELAEWREQCDNCWDNEFTPYFNHKNDPGTFYCTNEDDNYDGMQRYSPGPYLLDGSFNPLYIADTPEGNEAALSDFGGKANTDALVAGSYTVPAATACASFSPGYQNGNWYLPAIGELGFILARFDTINNKISQAVSAGSSGVALPLSYNFWSSSEYSQNFAWFLNTNFGYVYNFYKNYNYLVRAFLRL